MGLMIMDSEILLILGKMKLFKGLSEDELKMIAPYGRRLKFARNKTIIKEGDNGPGLHILISGEMQILLPQNAKEHHRLSNIYLGKLERGDYVGEYSLIDHQPASATVIAKEDCQIFHISCHNFEQMLENNDLTARKIYRNMLEVLVQRARGYIQELDLII